MHPSQLVVGVGQLAVVAAVVVVAWVVAVTLAVIVVFLRMIRRVNIGFPCFMKRRDGPTDLRMDGPMDGWTYGRTDLRTDPLIKRAALTINFTWTNSVGWGISIPNFKSLGHLDVR